LKKQKKEKKERNGRWRSLPKRGKRGWSWGERKKTGRIKDHRTLTTKFHKGTAM